MELRKMNKVETRDVIEIYGLETSDIIVYHNMNIGIFVVHLKDDVLTVEQVEEGLTALLPEYVDHILKTLLAVCKVDSPETIFITEYVSYADQIANLFIVGVLLLIVILIINYLGGF